MKVREKPTSPRSAPVSAPASPRAVDAEVASSTGSDGAGVAPPLPPATPGGLTAAAATTAAAEASAERPRAPWTPRAQEIAAAALAAAHGKSGDAAVAAVLDAVLAMPELEKARVSAAVSRAGHVVALRGTDDAVNPCSNSKLVTASYALSVLGADHRFATDVLRAPDGALVVKGGFDPTMTTDDLVALARDLKARGVDQAPRVVLDESALVGSDVPAAFSRYGDEDWEYVARPNPLSVNKSSVHLVVTPGPRLGAPAVIEADQTAFTIRNRVSTSTVKQPFHIGIDELDTAGVLERGPDGKAVVDVWGTIAGDYDKGKNLVMKSPSPVESFTDRLAFAFAEAGIRVGPIAVGEAPAGAVEVARHESLPLGEVLKTSVSTSNAFDHEMFALAAAMKERGRPVSLAEAAQSLTHFLESRGAAGKMVNASGIGNENRLRARDILALLDDARRDPRLHPLVDALARPGEDGTLKTRLLDTQAEGLFRGKTGTGNQAAALSGIAGDVSFSLLVDRAPGRTGVRAALDGMAIAVSALARGEA